MKRRIFTSLFAGTVTWIALIVWRHFFWHHALIVGIAVAALVYSIFSTADRLRQIYRS